jgi:hypothetical protein
MTYLNLNFFWFLFYITYTYNVSSCILPYNYHFLAASKSCMTHHQALRDFPELSLHKNNKNLPNTVL